MKSGARKPGISVIGAGAVGSAVARRLCRGGFRVLALVSRGRRTAARMHRYFPGAATGTSLSVLPNHSDILLLSVPEESLAAVVRTLASDARIDLAGSFVFHVSGTVGSEVLRPLRRRGAVTFSLHPIQAFPRSLRLDQRAALLGGISYGFEGEKRAKPIARKLVRLLRGRLIQIPKEKKILYHLACVFASNNLVVLYAIVERLTRLVGGSFSVREVHPLMRQALQEAMAVGAARAITGPVVRGSVSTIRQHLRELTVRDPGLRPLYRLLAAEALKLGGGMNAAQVTAIKRVLSQGRGTTTTDKPRRNTR